jgi:glycosyltransferase involved in cell wall biosynthesis
MTLQLLGNLNPTALGRLYSRAAIYAATSRYEPFGLAPLEAALSRCALVMNDIPSFREIWGDSACYFRRDDAGGLQQTLEFLAGNREEREAWANRAYTHAHLHYRAENMVDRYLGLYQLLTRAEVGAA